MRCQPDGPALSIVVVSFNTRDQLDRCLRTLTRQAIKDSFEILVVRAKPDDDRQQPAFCSGLPPARWVWAPTGSTVPQMRGLGFAQSHAVIVALVEDDCVVGDDWGVAVIRAHRSPYTAIGGPVEPGDYGRGIDWAAYFCDYVRFMRPFAGAAQALPGNNVSYKRSALEKLCGSDGVAVGLYEVFVHDKLLRAGHTLWAVPQMVVYKKNSWSFSQVSRVPYHHGRGFSSMRVTGWSRARRLSFAGAATLLPVVQCMRITMQVTRRRRHRVQLVQALPWIIVYSVCWSAGEFIGYLRGAGSSLEEWH